MSCRGDSRPNAPELSALLLLAFLHGLAGVVVQGGIGENGETYASMGINLSTSSVLPAAWNRLEMRGIGPKRVDAVLFNRTLGASTDPNNPTGLALVTGSNLVYWSTDALTYT